MLLEKRIWLLERRSWVRIRKLTRENIIRLALLLTLAHCSCSTREPEVNAPATPGKTENNIVTLHPSALQESHLVIDEARIGRLPEILVVTGKIGVDENRTARVGAIANGRVANVLANVGEHVKEGQRLAELNSHEIHDTRSEYAKAGAELDRRQGELQYARTVRDRAARLYELKAGSLEQLQRADADLRNAEMAITSAKAEIGRIIEHLDHLGLSAEGAMEEYANFGEKPGKRFEQNELIPVESPISGTILKRLVSTGTVVTPASDLFVISDLSSLWVNAEVPEKYLGFLKVGQTVQIKVQAYAEEIFFARITQIGDVLDPDTRMVQVRCQTNSSGQRLKPEMYASIRFEFEPGVEGIVVPSAAIHEVRGSPVVFTPTSETQFRLRQVRLGRQTGNLVEIIEGLKPGEKVVTTGSFRLKSEVLKREMAGE